MEKQRTDTQHDHAGHAGHDNHDEIEISLVDIVRPVVEGRKFISFFTLVCVAVALGMALLTASYKSESYYYFAGESNVSYNRYMDMAKRVANLEVYLNTMKQEDLPEAEMLRALFTSRDGIQKYVKPLYFFLQEADGVKRAKDAPEPKLLGMKFELATKKPEDTYKALTLVGQYWTDVISNIQYYEILAERLDNALTENSKIENELFEAKLQIPYLKRQEALVEALIEKYAKFFDIGRQAETVITTGKEGALDSSPIAQLLALQMEIAKLDQKTALLTRRQEQTSLFQSFYEKALESHQKNKTSAAFFTSLPAILPEVFKGQDMSKDTIKEVFNALSIQVQLAQNFYQENKRRLVAPRLITAPSTRFALIGAVALLAGLFLSVLIVWLRAWWRNAAQA